MMEAVNTGTLCQNCSGDIENRVYGSMTHFIDKWPRKGSVVNAVELGNLHAFNTFAIEWTPDNITWLINDVPMPRSAQKTGRAPFGGGRQPPRPV